MKQILVLEEPEIRLLERGKTFVFTTQTGEQLGIQFSRNGDSKVLKCPVCKVTETVSYPHKPFTQLTLRRHLAKAHGRKNEPKQK